MMNMGLGNKYKFESKNLIFFLSISLNIYVLGAHNISFSWDIRKLILNNTFLYKPRRKKTSLQRFANKYLRSLISAFVISLFESIISRLVPREISTF